MNRTISLLSLLAATTLVVGCGSDDDTEATGTGGTSSGSGGDDNGGSGGNGAGGGGGAVSGECDLSRGDKEEEVIPQNPDMTLTSDKIWLLEGMTYVEEGSTLTIEPCTRIEGQPQHPSKGQSVLVVSRGAKIMAEGEPDAPILFTSWAAEGDRQAGDWGGVIVLGRAPNNQGPTSSIEGLDPDPKYQHGGDDPEDDSGVIKYVRIEYPGVLLSEDNEVNGITFGSVGSGTEVHHVMVSNTLDDAFEWFGGTVNAHHLVASNADDDSFDADQGYTGELDTLFARLRKDVDSRDPNGFECDNNSGNPDLTPTTNVTSSKVTLCGPGEGVLSATANGAVFRRGFTGTFSDQVWLGWDNGVSLRDPAGTAEEPRVELTDSLFFANFENVIGTTHETSDPPLDPVEWFEFEGRNNEVPDPAPFELSDCLADDGPNEAVTGSGVGAFKDEADWMEGLWIDWAEQ